MLHRIDAEWYDLSAWNHPGGREILWRHSGQDITQLFYANHFGRFQEKKEGIRAYRLQTAPPEADRCPVPVLQACSPLYAELKRDVRAHLQREGIPWRHSFSWTGTVVRAALLLACALTPPGIAAGAVLASAYGVFTGWIAWTHAHNAVHNPARVPALLRHVWTVDLAGLVDVWMAEHHAHHALTNTPRDPDMRWFSPVLDYSAVASQGGGPGVLACAAVMYPFLLPCMLLRSAHHAVIHDARRRRDVAVALVCAPLRFGLDVLLLGPPRFALSAAAASLYLIATFVATHQTGPNHHRESSGDWMIDQLRATNSVAPTSRLVSLVSGGINNHIEHHLFPMVSNGVLHRIAPVVQSFCVKHELPYNGHATLVSLARSHTGWLGGWA